MKKILSIFLVLMMSIGLFNAPAYAGDFKDAGGHWAKEAITSLTNEGIISGYEDGTFKPNKQITRGEYVTLLNKLFNIKDSKVDVKFKDVTSDMWCYENIKIAISRGYVTGYPDKTFKPNDPITRAESCVMIARIIGGTPTKIATFKDNIPDWAKESISLIVEKGYVSGYPDGTFGATKNATRGEIASTLYRVKQSSNIPATKKEENKDNDKKDKVVENKNPDNKKSSSHSGGSSHSGSSSGGNSSSGSGGSSSGSDGSSGGSTGGSSGGGSSHSGSASESLNKKEIEKSIEIAKNKLNNIIESQDGQNVEKEKKWATKEAIEKLKKAISDASGILNNAKKQGELDKAVTDLNKAINEFKVESGKKVVPAPLNKEALTNAIKEANKKLENVEESQDGQNVEKGKKWATKEAIEKLKKAISDASGILNSATEQVKLDKAVTDLNKAINEFQPLEGKLETKATKYNSIKPGIDENLTVLIVNNPKYPQLNNNFKFDDTQVKKMLKLNDEPVSKLGNIDINIIKAPVYTKIGYTDCEVKLSFDDGSFITERFNIKVKPYDCISDFAPVTEAMIKNYSKGEEIDIENLKVVATILGRSVPIPYEDFKDFGIKIVNSKGVEVEGKPVAQGDNLVGDEIKISVKANIKGSSSKIVPINNLILQNSGTPLKDIFAHKIDSLDIGKIYVIVKPNDSNIKVTNDLALVNSPESLVTEDKVRKAYKLDQLEKDFGKITVTISEQVQRRDVVGGRTNAKVKFTFKDTSEFDKLIEPEIVSIPILSLKSVTEISNANKGFLDLNEYWQNEDEGVVVEIPRGFDSTSSTGYSSDSIEKILKFKELKYFGIDVVYKDFSNFQNGSDLRNSQELESDGSLMLKVGGRKILNKGGKEFLDLHVKFR